MPSAVRVDVSMLVKIEEPHNAETDYHEWFVTGKATNRDVLGRPNQGGYTTWRVVRCNSWECEATALVREDEIATAVHRVHPEPAAETVDG